MENIEENEEVVYVPIEDVPSLINALNESGDLSLELDEPSILDYHF